jgi:hypothetical protein
MESLPRHKFSVGPFQGWIIGKQLWAVRDKRSGAELAHASSMNECSRLAQRFYDAEKEAA